MQKTNESQSKPFVPYRRAKPLLHVSSAIAAYEKGARVADLKAKFGVHSAIFYKWMKRLNIPLRPRTRAQRPSCPICAKPIPWGNHKFCSNTCRQIYQPRVCPPRFCLMCEKKIGYRNEKYCSMACLEKHTNRHAPYTADEVQKAMRMVLLHGSFKKAAKKLGMKRISLIGMLRNHKNFSLKKAKERRESILTRGLLA